MTGRSEADALERLGAIVRRLRVDCPWDREQDERSIVPHTVEEAYELADAIAGGDSDAILDELGDVLFQVFFLSLLREERGAGSLAAVADNLSDKLIRRHPHVFGEESGKSAEVIGNPKPADGDQVRANWETIKRDVEGREDDGPFAGVAANLPATTYARKLLRRAESNDLPGPAPDLPTVFQEAAAALEALAIAASGGGDARPTAEPDIRNLVEKQVGELLLATVDAARRMGADPELALREAARRRVGLE